jgi:hypothetical protein
MTDKKPLTRHRRCGGSLPHPDADDGWRRCILESGHPKSHRDASGWMWLDEHAVTVTTVEIVQAVPDHRHGFVGDEDECVGLYECRLQWMEHRAEKPFVLAQKAPAEDACVDGNGNEYPEHDWEDTPTCRRCDAEPEEVADEEH